MTKPELTSSLKNFAPHWRQDFAHILRTFEECRSLEFMELGGTFKRFCTRTTASKRYKQIKNETKNSEIKNEKGKTSIQHKRGILNNYVILTAMSCFHLGWRICMNYVITRNAIKRTKLTEDWFCEWFWDECPCEGERSCRFTNCWWGRRRWLGDGPGEDPLLEPPGGPGFKPIFKELSGWVWSIRPFPP